MDVAGISNQPWEEASRAVQVLYITSLSILLRVLRENDDRQYRIVCGTGTKNEKDKKKKRIRDKR